MTTATATGPRNATTDERNGIRTYNWKGEDLTSVTSLRRLLGVPFPLANWMVEQAVKAGVLYAGNLDSIKAEEGEGAALTQLRKYANTERDTSANRGTLVHEAAAMGRHPADVDPEIGMPLKQFYDFLRVTGAKVVMQERQVWNLTMGYAGSLDVYLDMIWNNQRRLLVTDIKTGKGVYVDHALQLMGYGLGEFIGEDNKVDIEATNQLHKANGLAILHLSDTNWELIEVKATPELYSVFKAMVEFAHWQRRTPNVDTLVEGRWSK